MKPSRTLLGEGFLPIVVFTVVAIVHFLWTSSPPEPVTVISPWASLPVEEPSRLSLYAQGGGYWQAYSYGISFAFAAVAARRLLRKRTAAGGGVALGGATLSGLVAFFGCYLTGCCGSPMLVVYLNLFGAGFLPFAKPFIAAVTTLSIFGAWWWMRRLDRRRASCCGETDTGSGGCCP